MTFTSPSNEGTERKTDRLEAFSDAVLAIAITLPVVEIHLKPADKPGALFAAYAALGPELAAYGVGATVIALFWAHSHFTGKIVEKTDHGFNLLTMLFLALVSLTPIPAGPMVGHLAGDADSALAAQVYTCTLALPATLWLARWIYAVRLHLVDRRLDPAYLNRLTLKYVATSAAYWTAAGFTWVNWRVGLGAAVLVTLGYLVPPLAPVFKPGQKPRHELEEADEAVDREADEDDKPAADKPED